MRNYYKIFSVLIVLLIGAGIWLFTQDGHFSVSVAIPLEMKEAIVQEFSEATNGKLVLECRDTVDNNGITVSDCTGMYMTTNLSEIITYENKIFDIGEKYHVDISTFGSGITAKWFD